MPMPSSGWSCSYCKDRTNIFMRQAYDDVVKHEETSHPNQVLKSQVDDLTRWVVRIRRQRLWMSGEKQAFLDRIKRTFPEQVILIVEARCQVILNELLT